MSNDWFVRPETTRINLEGGHWIEVKRYLTIGEVRRSAASVIKEVRPDGRITPDMTMMGQAEVIAYLLDWSLRGGDDKPVPIETDAQKLRALDALAPDKFAIISEAISKHVEAMKSARDAEKNEQVG